MFQLPRKFGEISAKLRVIIASVCLLYHFSAPAPSLAQFIKIPRLDFRRRADSLAVDSLFLQTHPDHEAGVIQRSAGQRRAVVLIHGLRLQPFQPSDVNRARLHGWQRAKSLMVRWLAAQADVFAFAYRQNVPVDAIAGSPCLAEGIQNLKWLGYEEIVLIGHSAGGVIARQFVEDHPYTAVTKVIQVCAPNTGAAPAELSAAAPVGQRPFLKSLTKDARKQSLDARAHKIIPAGVEFICVIGCGAGFGDGIVSTKSQWPENLRAQGVQGYPLLTTHYTVMRSPVEIKRIVQLACGPRDKLDDQKWSWKTSLRGATPLTRP
jgi:hypothetical protein